MRFTDPTQHLEENTYAETRLAVIDMYKKLEGVLEIVEFGTIPFLGISDMDFHVVVEPGASMTIPGLKAYAEEQRYAMEHMHFVLSKNVLPKLRFFDPWLMHLDPLFDPSSKEYCIDAVRELSEEERHELSFSFILLGHILPILKPITEIACTGILPQRDFLETIKATTYCYRELHRAGVIDEGADPRWPRFNALRQEWFTLSAEEQQMQMEEVYALYRESQRCLLTMLSDMLQERASSIDTPEELIAKHEWQKKLLSLYPRSLIHRTHEETFIYQEGRTEMMIACESVRSPLNAQTYETYTYLLPLSLAALPNIFLGGSGPVSRFYQSCCCTDLPSIPLYEPPILTELASAIDQNLEETRNVQGGKQPFTTFGAEKTLEKPKEQAALRARLGGVYDRTMERVSATPLKYAFHRQSILESL